ncbi:polyamine-modulated factor 1 [Amazona ochrocephala]
MRSPERLLQSLPCPRPCLAASRRDKAAGALQTGGVELSPGFYRFQPFPTSGAELGLARQATPPSINHAHLWTDHAHRAKPRPLRCPLSEWAGLPGLIHQWQRRCALAAANGEAARGGWLWRLNMAEAMSGGEGGGNGGDGGGNGGGNGGDGGGSPGPGRAELFSTVVDAFLEKLLAAGSYQRFASCYRGFSKLQPELTKSIHTQFVSQLQAAVRAEIREVMEEGNLKVVLDSLDKIVEEEKTQEEPTWRPSGLPEEDARSALVPPLLKHRSFLLRTLRTQQEENRKVAASVLQGRGRIRELQEQIRAHARGWKALREEQQELVLSLQEPH